jgi:hypothetical protein
MKLDYTKNGHDYGCESESLPRVAVEFYLQYGFQQSNGDSFASVVTDVMADLADKAKAAGHSFPKPKTDAWKQLAKSDEVQAIAKPLIHAAILKRIERVNAGKVTARETDPFVVECRDVAIESLTANAAKENIELPARKTDAWKALLADAMAHPAVVAEAKKRMKAPTPTIDLSSMLAKVA